MIATSRFVRPRIPGPPGGGFWTWLSALAMLYQLFAVRTGRMRISRASHTWPWALLVWAAWASFG